MNQSSFDKSSTFLVEDKSLGFLDAPFYDWLKENGFKKWGCHGNYGMSWVFVDISTKIYACGIPGIPVVDSYVGNHAITINEFFEIYNIFKRYENLNPLEMGEKL